ncbi:MAG: hypothetical protein WC414_04095 [Patescibacteria group bacterium]
MKNFEKVYVVTVDMGYGHQRAVYPLKDIATVPNSIDLSEYKIINCNNYPGIPKKDEKKWKSQQIWYERISRMKHLPIIGNKIFGIMDFFQRIQNFYPARDLSKPTLQLKLEYAKIKQGLGKDLIEKLNKEPLPMITSFFTAAYFAEEYGYKEEIYLICCDADVSRAWAPLYPKKSRIKYLVPNRRVNERLKSYGVKAENIFITGFPLPKECVGRDLKILKENLLRRVTHLDLDSRFRKKYHHTLEEFFGKKISLAKNGHEPIHIMFAVGGAGAQRELGITIADSLKKEIIAGRIELTLIAGVKKDVCRYYQEELKKINLLDRKNVSIIFAEDKKEYFKKFNQVLNKADILWTKPSELSFYVGLGIPIIMAPTIGAQEKFNQAWLEAIGSGVRQEDPQYTNEWLFDWLKSGWLAQAAFEGVFDAPRNGVYHIEKIVLENKKSEIEDLHLL